MHDLTGSQGLLPDGAVVKRGGDRQQQVSQQVKNEPYQQTAACELEDPQNQDAFAVGARRRIRLFREAVAAKHPAPVLGDTFPAEKPLAAQTPRCGLPLTMAIAALVDEFRH
jgi:hypothetical protein